MKFIVKKYGFTENLLDQVINIKDVEVVYATEPDLKAEHEFLGKELLPTYKAVGVVKDGKADGILINSDVEHSILTSMVEELYAYGLKQEHIYILRKEFSDSPNADNIIKYENYHYLPYIEYHVANHCNLNCSGCVHFSPLVEEKAFPEFGEVCNDLKQIKKLVFDIDEIHILGGEPLLNPELDKYIIATRDIFPYARIVIVTNGLLVKTMSDSLINTIKEYAAEIAISLYEPMLPTIHGVLEFLNERNLTYSCSNPVAEFAYTFDKEGGHARGVKKLTCSCPNLYKGKLCICPPIAYADYFNREFGEELCIPEDEGRIDIYDAELTYERLVKKLHTPVAVCDKCLYISREDAISFKWKQTENKNINDYVYEEC